MALDYKQPTNRRIGDTYDPEDRLPYRHGGGPATPAAGGGFTPGSAGRTRNAEASPSSRHRRAKGGHSKAEEEEQQKLESGPEASQDNSEEKDGFYNHKHDKALKFTMAGLLGYSKRNKGKSGLVALGGAGAIGILLLGIGPFEFIHMAQSLQNFHWGNNESMIDGRVMKIVRYGRHNLYRENLGFFSNQLADIYERKLARAGMKANYDGPDGRPRFSIQSFTIDPSTPQGRSALGNLQANGVDIPDPGPNGKITIDLRGVGSTKTSRRVIAASLETIGLNKVSGWMGGRLLKARALVNFHPFRNAIRDRIQSRADYRRRLQAEREDEVRNGSRDVDRRRPADNPDDPDGQDDRNRVGDDADDIVDADPDVTTGRLRSAATGAGSALGLFTLFCAADAFGEDIGNLQYQNLVLPLIRLGTFAMSMGNQAMSSQDLNAEELGAFSEQLFDPETGLGWSAAKSIQAEYGVENPSGPDMPEAAKPRVNKPLFFNSLDAVLDSIPGSAQACEFLLSTAGQWANTILDGILAAMTGGTWAVLKLVGGEVFGSIAGVAMEPFLKDLANWLAGKPVEEFARGALYGNYVNYGSRLAANDSAISTGGTELSNSDEARLDADREDRYKEQLQHKSLYARLLDPKERGSLLARTVLQNSKYTNPQAATTNFAQLPSTVFAQISSSFSNIFTPRLQAQTATPYNYGFPEFGYTLELQDDPRFDDPYENAEKVNATGPGSFGGIEALNAKWGDCFNMSITTDGKLRTTKTKRYDEIDEKCKGSNEDLLRYRFYIADTVTYKSMVCFNDLDESACDELGFGSGSGGGSGGSGATLDGVTCPADLQPHPSQAGYFRMPDAPNGEYTIYASEARRYGSEQLVCVLYSVALAYNEAMGGRSKMSIGDLNAGAPHASHNNGVAADLDGQGEIVAADNQNFSTPPYSTEATVTLGKLFVDTGVLQNLWWCDDGDGSLQQIIDYAVSKGTPLAGARCIDGHYNHFHIDILDQYALPGSFTP